MCPAYIAGLIGPGDRKSVQPMAARSDEISYDRLHHFVSAGVWDNAPVEDALVKAADRLVGDEAGFLVIDDTALPKKGTHSVGVAPQYASSLGKTANCQSLVSVTLASREVPVMVGLRLFLPDEWTSDPARLTRARVLEDKRTPLTKPEIAIEEIDRVIASGARFGCALADAGYGSSGPFRQALSLRSLSWAVGLSRRQNIYPADVTRVFPTQRLENAASTMSRINRRSLSKPLWPQKNGNGSAGAGVPKAGSTIVCSACRAMRSCLSANAGRAANKNIMCRTYRPRRASRRWLRRSRPDGSVSRPISNSRKNWGSTISKGGPGSGCTATP